jgi:hypothetical protein
MNGIALGGETPVHVRQQVAHHAQLLLVVSNQGSTLLLHFLHTRPAKSKINQNIPYSHLPYTSQLSIKRSINQTPMAMGPETGDQSSVLRIRDVCPGSRIRLFSIPDPHQKI